MKLLAFAVLIMLCGISASTPLQKPPASVKIFTDSKTFTLQELAEIARSRIRKDDAEFEGLNLDAGVLIYTGKKKATTFSVSFEEGLGKRVWNVEIDSKGKVTHYSRRRSVD